MPNNKFNIIQNINENQPEIRKWIDKLINNKINMILFIKFINKNK